MHKLVVGRRENGGVKVVCITVAGDEHHHHNNNHNTNNNNNNTAQVLIISKDVIIFTAFLVRYKNGFCLRAVAKFLGWSTSTTPRL